MLLDPKSELCREVRRKTVPRAQVLPAPTRSFSGQLLRRDYENPDRRDTARCPATLHNRDHQPYSEEGSEGDDEPLAGSYPEHIEHYVEKRHTPNVRLSHVTST